MSRSRKRPSLEEHADPTFEAIRAAFSHLPAMCVVVEPGSYRVVAANLKATDQAPPGAVTCHEVLWGAKDKEGCGCEECVVDHVTATWIPFRLERSLTTGDGLTRVVEVEGFPIRDASGTVRWIGVTAIDTTERRHTDRVSAAQDQVMAIGEWAGATAHRFNNLLQVIVSSIHLALADLESGSLGAVRSTLEDVLANVEGGKEAVTHLLEVAQMRAGAAGPGPSDLSVIVGQVCSMVSPVWRPEEGAAVRLEEDLCSACIVRGSPQELRELATSLIRRAMGIATQGSTVRVSTKREGGDVVLSVSYRPKAAEGDGGLRIDGGPWVCEEEASARLIAERLGGTVMVDSASSMDSAYVVRLPSADSAEGPGRERVPERYSILLVDDNREVLATLEDGLRREGHLVLTAQAGRAALQILGARTVDAVVCDLAMPEMNGLEVGEALLRLCEERGMQKPAFILLTGWLYERERRNIEAAGIDRVVQKPIDPARLAGIIRQTVSSRR